MSENTATTAVANMDETSTITVLESAGSDTLNADIERLKRGQVNVFSSYTPETFSDRISLVAAMSNSTPLDEVLGQKLELVHYIVQPIDMVDEKTGELRSTPRIILMTADGNSYHAISTGIMSALKNLCGLAGMPVQWPEPVTVIPTKEKTSNKFNVFTLKYA